jgi:hypothetical protein
MSKQHNATGFDAVIGLYNVKSLDRRQEIWNRAITRAGTARPISAKCGFPGLNAVSVNP